MGLDAGIWSPKERGGTLEKKKKKKKKEKFPLCESTGHRPLRDRCLKRNLQ